MVKQSFITFSHNHDGLSVSLPLSLYVNIC